MVSKKELMLSVLTVFFLATALFSTVWIAGSAGDWDPWMDVDENGRVDMLDLYLVARKYGTTGAPLTKGAIEYDSGWINITDKAGQSFDVTHDLNSMDVIIDIEGKTTADGGVHQKHLGGTKFVTGWNATYSGTNDDWAYALVQTGDGGYALAGEKWLFGAGYCDCWLVKTDANGDEQWNMTYGGTSDDRALALVQTGDGGYALAGSTASFGAGSGDFWLVKTDANGNLQWNKTYGGTGYDYAWALAQTSDGGYALAGSTGSFGAGSWDFWLVKTDANGNEQWNMTYGGIGNDEARALAQTSEGGYALAGWTASFGAGSWDFWLVKTDANGNMQWNKTYGGTSTDHAWALVQTGDGGYALAGYTYSFGAGGDDFWLVKTDANGNEQWNMTYGGTSTDRALALVQTSDGGYALAGSTDSFGTGSDNFRLVKTDAAGNAFDSFTYGLAWTDSSANTITLFRGTNDPYWNYVRVRVWKPKTP